MLTPNQTAVRMPAQCQIQPAAVKGVIPDHRFRIMTCQNIDTIHLSQRSHESLLFVSSVIVSGDLAQIHQGSTLNSKADNLVLQLHCSQTGQCLIQSSIYIRNIPLNILLMVTVLIILFSLHLRQCLQIPENSALHSFLQFKKLY